MATRVEPDRCLRCKRWIRAGALWCEVCRDKMYTAAVTRPAEDIAPQILAHIDGARAVREQQMVPPAREDELDRAMEDQVDRAMAQREVRLTIEGDDEPGNPIGAAFWTIATFVLGAAAYWIWSVGVHGGR